LALSGARIDFRDWTQAGPEFRCPLKIAHPQHI
jgi:hypothetical protein